MSPLLEMALRVFGLLALLVGLGAWGVRWARARGLASTSIDASPVLGRVVQRVPVGSRQALVVVESGSKHLVLGVTEGSIHLLAERDAREAARPRVVEESVS